MSTPLRVLMLEDRQADARLVIHELRQAGYDPQWERVDTEAEFLARVHGDWDIILADYSMPQFEGPQALRLARERGIDIPFIIVSGTIGEEIAVTVMKEGASDYLLKDRLVRLGPAVKQALEQRQLRLAEQQAAEALRESRERTRLILDTAYDAFMAMDADGRITDWNKQAEATFGWTREEAIGRTLAETIIPPALRPAHWAGLAKYLAGGPGPILNRHLEMTAIRRDGSEFPVELNVWPVHIGGTATFSAFVRDISEQKRLAAQLRQAQKMEAVGRLAGGVAHDFNNLLTIITGYSDLAIGQLNSNPAIRELVEEIREAALRATTLTRQLLAFSRQQVLVPVVFDLNGLVHEMEKMLRRVIGEDIDLSIHLTADPWLVRVDAGQMEQVVMNLVLNARDAMPEGGKLTVETANVTLSPADAAKHPDARPGEYVLLSVTDTGIGMDAATASQIFEPFFTTKGPDKGTGLGLATVYGIVKQSGGCIEVFSKPGEGASFKVYLPRETADKPRRNATSSPGTQSGGTETILLVEDEDGVRSLARLVLESHGYSVLEASNGEQALAMCQRSSQPIDLLATDVVMPQMSGTELARRLEASQPKMRVLLMSGYTDDATTRSGLINGRATFLQKPYTPDTLAQKVREALDRTIA